MSQAKVSYTRFVLLTSSINVELIKGDAGVELPLFSISHECQSITLWINIKTLSYQNKMWQSTISSSNNVTKPEMLKISLNVRSHTREIVHVYNIKPISCSMLSDHIDVEQSKTLSISWKDDHCGNNLRRNRKEGGMNHWYQSSAQLSCQYLEQWSWRKFWWDMFESVVNNVS